MDVMIDAMRRALRMGAAGADNRIVMRSDGSYTVKGDGPPTFTREELAQNDSGTFAFVYWEQSSDQDRNLTLIVEGIDCSARRAMQFAIPMRRRKPKKYAALMVKAGDGQGRPEPEVPAIQSPRYAGWDLDRFVEWCTWRVSGFADLAMVTKHKKIAGFAWVTGDRESTWCHRYSDDSEFQPTESGVRAGSAAELAVRGRRNDWPEVEEGGRATFIALWWPVLDGAQIVCAEPATGTARKATLTVTSGGGPLVPRLLGLSNQVSFTSWQPATWDPVDMEG